MMWYAISEDLLGLIPSFLDEQDERPARTQIAGWSPFEGFRLGESMDLLYEGDPPLSPAAWARLHNELIVVYPYGWVAIIQPDDTFEVARCD